MRYLTSLVVFLLWCAPGVMAQCPQYDLSHLQEEYELNCENNFSITLQAILDGEPPASIEWWRSNELIGTENEITITEDYFPYRLDIEGQDGCTENFYFSVTTTQLDDLPNTMYSQFCLNEVLGNDFSSYCLSYVPANTIAVWPNGNTGLCSDNIPTFEPVTIIFTDANTGACLDIREYNPYYDILDANVTVEGESCGDTSQTAIFSFYGTGFSGQYFVYLSESITNTSYDTVVTDFQFTWDLPPGRYNGWVDSWICFDGIGQFTITPPALIISSLEVDSIVCASEGISSVSLDLEGGMPPFELRLDDGDTTITYEWEEGQTIGTIDSLAAGDYALTITGILGCSTDTTFSITQPDTLVVTLADSIAPTCYGDGDGSLRIAVSGGVGSYTYEWSNGEDSTLLENLVDGVYSVTVTDSLGCTAEATYALTQPDSLQAVMVASGPANCLGEPVGYLQIEVIGGSGEYDISWSNGGDSTRIENLAAGNYSVTIIDANGCTAEATYELNGGIDAVISWSGDGTLNCLDDFVILSVEPLGTDFTYLWSGPGIDGQIDATVTATELGIYFVTVTNNSQPNCTGLDSFTVVDGSEPFDFVLSSSVANCESGNEYLLEGTIAETGSTYDYVVETGGQQVADGQTSDTLFTTLVENSGVFTVTLTDTLTGCVETRDYEIQPYNPAEIEFIVDTAVCFYGLANIEATVVSGTEPFSWQWSNGTTSPLLFDVASGTYTVTVTDGNGCAQVQEVFAGISDPFDVEFVSTIPDCGETNGSIAVTNITGGIPPFTYIWSNGSEAPVLENVGSGLYELTIVDALDCENTLQISLANEFQGNIIEGPVGGQGCEGSLPQLTAIPNSANFTYNWDGPGGFTSTEASFSAPLVGLYSVTITAVDGSCSDVAEAVANFTDELFLTGIDVDPVPCFDFTILTPQYSQEAFGEIIHRWVVNGDTIIQPGLTIQAEEPGSYVYIGTNTFSGCVLTDSLFLATVGVPCEGVVGRLWAVQDDCVLNGTEVPVANTPIRIEDVDGTAIHYTVTDSEGVYQTDLSEGTYEAYPLPFAEDIYGECDDVQIIEVDEDGNSLDKLFIVYEEACPAMHVNVAAPNLVRCFNNYAYLYYCNDGPVLAEDATITVELDPFLIFQGASIPPTSASEQLITFELGDLAPFDCGTIRLNLLVSCDAAFGQTHCIEAMATPNDPCPTPNDWNGANLVLGADCLTDSLEYRIVNDGTATTSQAVSYLVIEDGIMMLNEPGGGPFLNPGEEFSFRLPANGSTYRLEAEQEPGNPGFSTPTLVMEGCGTNQAGNFSTGFVNQLPLNDTDVSWYDIVCRENTGAFDPNDKMGLPLGVGEPGFIKPRTPIVYDIQFQNTGTDTARNVVLRDTIAPQFDLNTLRLGAASHDYTYTLDSNRALTITFADIMLPDSFVNEAASWGVVSFYIEHYPGLTEGTELRNQAAIYFDFNEPIFTSVTLHTLGKGEFSTGANHFSSGQKLTVFPNPAKRSSQLTFECSVPGAYILEIFDGFGRKVLTHRSKGGISSLDVSRRPVGWHLARATRPDGSIIGLKKFLLK